MLVDKGEDLNMTIIAYKDGVLAAASLWVLESSLGRAIRFEGDPKPKIYPVVKRRWVKHELVENKALFGVAGDMESCAFAEDCILSAGPMEQDPEITGFESFLIEEELGSVYFNSSSPLNFDWKDPEFFMALGIGKHTALGAMAYGASAKEAVDIACRFHTSCGGDVVTINVNEFFGMKGS